MIFWIHSFKNFLILFIIVELYCPPDLPPLHMMVVQNTNTLAGGEKILVKCLVNYKSIMTNDKKVCWSKVVIEWVY